MEPTTEFLSCSEHTGHRVSSYCQQCKRPICAVCCAIDHSGHTVMALTDLMVECLGSLNEDIAKNEAAVQTLINLANEVGPSTTMLDQYIDRELNSMDSTLEAKRRSLHTEVDQRAQEARRQLQEELAWVERELHTLTTGAAVLDCLSKRHGVVEDDLGGLISEAMSFDEFMSHVDAPLHDPPRMLEMLGLQLPTQSLQEVCDLISWTNITAEPTRQIFPTT
ncbi:zinc finger protein, putative [Bodo saltans]|uniref:Zinc finger protein, putative n=1 Tax=Bodo saltans TaxID=75058 RepID=A0A0S4J7B5_BODSA|nr:zinc finger protein, putative [Bodo saltans]|eukprot:CUG87377.1 zinc finger protein, putative [Bodo saltans]